MPSVKRAATLVTCLTVFAFVPVALLGQPARAQTMGEYGATLGHNASAASSMPRPNLPNIPFTSQGAAASNPRGSTHTEVIRDYDYNDSTADSASNDENPDPKNPASGWERIK